MISGKNYTVSFAAAILGVTTEEQLVKPIKNMAKSSGPQSTSLLEDATDNLVSDLALAKRTYGTDVLALTVVCRSVENLLANTEVGKYLRQNHLTVLDELKQVVSQISTERTEDLQGTSQSSA